MRHRFFDLAFTPSVRAEQTRRGSRAAYASREAEPIEGGPAPAMTQHETGFIAARDSFYLASVSETGWPYVQHRGGPAGFIHVVDERTLAWAEFAGNRQYVSMGNTAANARVALFLMDYPNQRRLKILGRLHSFEAAERPDLALRLTLDSGKARVERFVVVTVEAFDWNCPKYITPRFTLPEIEAMAAPLRARIAELEARLSQHGETQTAKP